MQLKMYTIFDTAADVFMRPFFSQADGAAIREFGDLAVAADHPIGQHPEHYQLWKIGEFFDNTGEVVPQVPEILAHAHELARKAQHVNGQRLAVFDEEVSDATQ